MKRLCLLSLVTVLLALAGSVRVVAQDAPHWTGAQIAVDCTTPCHITHHAMGGGLTTSAANVNLCQSCHNPAGLAGDLPINSVDSAVPGVSGTSHAFGAGSVNPLFGAEDPLNPHMLARVMDGQVVCSTCHDQHSAEAVFGGQPRISPARQVTALGSTGLLTSGGTYSGADGTWYLVGIVTAGDQSTALFRYSKDNGISWFPTPPATLVAGTDVPLDNGVTVTFRTGNYAADERWEFSASWPFLRAALDSGDNSSGDAYCRDCHRSWVMDHNAVHTYDGNYKSHPVGILLNANGMGYDRSVPLDGNGAEQGSAGGDANPTNDFLFDDGGLVQCLSCHGVHYVDSNTLSVDGP